METRHFELGLLSLRNSRTPGTQERRFRVSSSPISKTKTSDLQQNTTTGNANDGQDEKHASLMDEEEGLRDQEASSVSVRYESARTGAADASSFLGFPTETAFASPDKKHVAAYTPLSSYEHVSFVKYDVKNANERQIMGDQQTRGTRAHFQPHFEMDMADWINRTGQLEVLSDSHAAMLEQTLATVHPQRSRAAEDKMLEVDMEEYDNTGSMKRRQITMRQLGDELARTAAKWDRQRKPSLGDMLSKEESKQTDGSKMHGVGAIRVRMMDLRLLDHNITPVGSFSIVVRRHAVLIALDPIRAVVTSDTVVLMTPPGGMDHILTTLGGFMQTWSLSSKEQSEKTGQRGHADNKSHPAPAPAPAPAAHRRSVDVFGPTVADEYDDDMGEVEDSNYGSTPTYFEVHAYEAIFTTLSTLHAQQFKALAEDAEYVLQYFKQLAAIIIPQDIQERFQVLKTDLDVFVNRLKAYRRALTTLSEDDEAMALMNLSILRDQPWYYNAPLRPEILACHDEIEEMIESYLVEASSVLVRAENLVVKVRYISLGSQWAALWLPCD